MYMWLTWLWFKVIIIWDGYEGLLNYKIPEKIFADLNIFNTCEWICLFRSKYDKFVSSGIVFKFENSIQRLLKRLNFSQFSRNFEKSRDFSKNLDKFREISR